MTDEPQPELRWAPLPPQPKKSGRVWLIIGLVVAALAVVGVLLFFLLPRDGAPAPAESASSTPSASADSEPEPDATPIATPPPAVDPSIDVFRERVSGWLNDAPRGLDIIEDASGQDALPVVQTLQEDAQRLSDIRPPSSIEQEWREAVSEHSERLTRLHSAIADDADVTAAVDAARESAQTLRSVVGL